MQLNSFFRPSGKKLALSALLFFALPMPSLLSGCGASSCAPSLAPIPFFGVFFVSGIFESFFNGTLFQFFWVALKPLLLSLAFSWPVACAISLVLQKARIAKA